MALGRPVWLHGAWLNLCGAGSLQRNLLRGARVVVDELAAPPRRCTASARGRLLALAQAGHSLHGLPRVLGGMDAVPPAREPDLESVASDFGTRTTLRHSAHMARKPPAWPQTAMPPRSPAPTW